MKGLVVLVYGILVGDDGPLDLASIPGRSLALQLLLLGSRWHQNGGLDNKGMDHWEEILGGTLLYALHRSAADGELYSALIEPVPPGTDPRRFRPNQNQRAAFAEQGLRRPWPEAIRRDWARRIARPDTVDLDTRVWVARDVWPSGPVNRGEIGLAAQWIQQEPSALVRRSLLTATLRSGGGEESALRTRLRTLVEKGDKDASSALRVLFSIDREGTYVWARDEFSKWRVGIRATAVHELVLRFPQRAWEDYGEAWIGESADSVCRRLMAETARQGLGRFAGVRATLYRFGDAHYKFIEALNDRPQTRKLARVWLDFLGGRK